VSSTRIREAVRAGDFDAASQMLGRAYSLAGEVTRGEQLGRKLGFPTANLALGSRLLPPEGVYAAHATVNGQSHRAVLNIGRRPTVAQPAPAPRVEVHLLDFAGEVYGAEMEVTFAARLRGEEKFASLEALQAQIAQDVVAARKLF
jgi:riboflavin kinase/FMN adenylyltransferase